MEGAAASNETVAPLGAGASQQGTASGSVAPVADSL